MTTYYSSTGPKVVEEMERQNAFFAAAKLRREGFGDSENSDETIAALDARVAKLDAEWEAKVAPYKAAGYSVREAFDAIGKKHFEAWHEDAGSPKLLSAYNKSESAAWADVFARYNV